MVFSPISISNPASWWHQLDGRSWARWTSNACLTRVRIVIFGLKVHQQAQEHMSQKVSKCQNAADVKGFDIAARYVSIREVLMCES